MMARIRPVFEWQYGNAQGGAQNGLGFLEAYWGNADGQAHVASPYPRHSAVGIETYIHDEVAARHLGDARAFLVDGIVDQRAGVGKRMTHHVRAMKRFDSFQRGYARTDDLAAAAVAGPQVRLNEAGGDLEIGFDIAVTTVGRWL